MALLINPISSKDIWRSYANTVIALEPGETKSKQLESVEAEADSEVRKEKKKKTKTIAEDEIEAEVRKEKKKTKSKTIEEDEEEVGVVDHSDYYGEMYARKEKKKKSRTIEEDMERDSDSEMCTPKRRKSGERSKCRKKSKKQQVA